MGWLTDLIRRIVTDVAMEVLVPKMEERLEVVMDRKMRQLFNEVWLPRLQAMWREDLRQAFEQDWLPRLQTMWREDLREVQDRFDLRFDSVQGRLDSISEMVLRRTEPMATELVGLVREVHSLREEVDRIKAHIGMTGGDAR